MNGPLLNDENTFPSDDVIEAVLNENHKLYLKFIDILEDRFPNIEMGGVSTRTVGLGCVNVSQRKRRCSGFQYGTLHSNVHFVLQRRRSMI